MESQSRSPDGIPDGDRQHGHQCRRTWRSAVQNAALDMGELNGNSGSGNGLNGIQLSQDTVAVSSSLPWTGTSIPCSTADATR